MTDGVDLELKGARIHRNSRAMALAAGVTVISGIAGLILSGWPGALVGLVVGLVFTFVGPATATRNRETTRIHVG
jgi:uncharacterized protein (DUF58 family)